MTLPVDTPLVCPVLVGRSVHIEAMRRLADRARSGAGGAILLSGEAGTGKSRLAADMRDWAMDDGWRVLVGLDDVIGGAWTDADGGATQEVNNPATGEILGTVPRMGADETRRAIVEALDACRAFAP